MSITALRASGADARYACSLEPAVKRETDPSPPQGLPAADGYWFHSQDVYIYKRGGVAYSQQLSLSLVSNTGSLAEGTSCVTP